VAHGSSACYGWLVGSFHRTGATLERREEAEDMTAAAAGVACAAESARIRLGDVAKEECRSHSLKVSRHNEDTFLGRWPIGF
jgi:hypothetical protein